MKNPIPIKLSIIALTSLFITNSNADYLDYNKKNLYFYSNMERNKLALFDTNQILSSIVDVDNNLFNFKLINSGIDDTIFISDDRKEKLSLAKDGEKISFGKGGGVLDLNGTSINFTSINHEDNKAVIINSNNLLESLINIDSNKDDIFLGIFGGGSGKLSVNLSTDGKFGLLNTNQIDGSFNFNKGHTIVGNKDNFVILKASDINVASNATLSAYVNSEIISENLTINPNATVRIGPISLDDSNNILCIRDKSNNIECNSHSLSNFQFNDGSSLSSNVILKEDSNLIIGKASFHGTVNAHKESNITLTSHANWYIDKNNVDSAAEPVVGNIINNGSIIFNRSDLQTINITNKITGNGLVLLDVDVENKKASNLIFNSNGNRVMLGTSNSKLPDFDKIKVGELKNGSTEAGNDIKLAIDPDKNVKYKLVFENNNIYLSKKTLSTIVVCSFLSCYSENINKIATTNDINVHTLVGVNDAVLNYFSSLSANTHNRYASFDLSSVNYVGQYYLTNKQLNSHITLGADTNRFFSDKYFIGSSFSLSSGSSSGSLSSNNSIIKGLVYLRFSALDNVFINTGIGIHHLVYQFDSQHTQFGYNVIASVVSKFNLYNDLYIIPDTSIEYYSLSPLEAEGISFSGSSIFKFKAGSKLNYDIGVLENIKYSIYLSSYVSSLYGVTKAAIEKRKYNLKHERTGAYLSFGLNLDFNKRISSELNTSYTFSNNYKSSFNTSLKLKVNF